ncbi:MAG: response regulator transcription factor [Chloroflexota bacterium]
MGDPNAQTLLIVEDDQQIAGPLCFGMEREGFRVLRARDGHDALALAREDPPDLVLLDVMLPGPDGFQVCRTLRGESSVPIIMLTARGAELDRVMGLEIGADDYVVKPFSFRELVARVRALLRRRELDQAMASATPDRLVSGDLVVDRAARKAWRSGHPIELTNRELSLLIALMERPGQAIHRQELLDLAWGRDWVGDQRTLDVLIRWLREKLEDEPSAPRLIETVRGYGYRCAAAAPNDS